MKPDSRKETSAMGNRLVIAVLLGLLLFSAVSFGQDWQYANVFNLVEEGYGPWIPSWYTTSYGRIDSYTPSTPSLRTATMRTADGRDERPVPLNHDQTVLRFDLLSSTDDFFLKGVTVTLIGSADFDPNEDLAPIHPDTARTIFCVDDTIKSLYTGFQFYVEKGEFAGSCVDSLDTIDIEDMPTPLLTIDDTVMAGTPPAERIYPAAQSWTDVTGTYTGTYPVGWRVWQAQINFKRHIEIRNEADIDPSYGLPFLRMWVLLKPMGCHECIESSNDGGFIEGLSNRDSFYVQITETNDLHVYDVLGVDDASGYEIVRDVELPIGRTEVRWDTPNPDPADAARWASSGMLIGGDTIPPFITDLIPRNEVPTNGDFTDQGGLAGCDEMGDEIWTADSCQPISFVAYDKSTCIDSVFVEIRYLNGTSCFHNRVDSIYYRSSLEFSADVENGGAGQPWEVRVRPYGSGWSDWELVYDVATEFEVMQSGMCADGYCGHDTFYIDIGRDIPDGSNYLAPFHDGANVQVTVRVFNRNYNVGTTWAHRWPMNYDAYQDTVWDFFVDLSGPNAELVCPGTTDDNYTEEFYGGAPGWRQDYIEGENINWRWISDSLPLVQVHLYDGYQEVHDENHHGDPFPFWSCAEGGCGINERDFEFTFVLNRLTCLETSYGYVIDTFVVTESDLNLGCWFDEFDNGEEGYMWIDFEDLETYRTDLTGTLLDGDPILPLRSGDILEIHQTELFDDPDYGQGTYRFDVFGWFHTGPSDLIMSGSYGTADAPDPNYGCRDRRILADGDSHTPVDDQAATAYGTTAMVDTLGILRIDLEGPVAPDTFFYPPHGWVTSDTLQVITVDLYDQIGCPVIDQNLSADTDHMLDQFVAGVYGRSDDNNSRLAINLVVKSASGHHHPDYVEFPSRPWEGRTWYVPGWETNCATQPHHIEKINQRWGTRLTFAPRQHEPFRSGDKVCVTVYAWDNAVTDCDYDTLFTTDLTCSDGTVWQTVDNWIPDRNWADDEWDTDDLERTHAEVARFCFYVDITPPIFVESKLYPLCDDTLTFTIRDTSEVISPTFCDEWIAGIGAADLRMWIYDDEDTLAGSHDDFLFYNDLVPAVPTGAVQVDTTHDIVGRENRYMYARMDFGDDPAREGIIKVWKDCNANSCHVLEPEDSVVVEIWAGDNPNVPWYAATQRPESEAGYHARNVHSTSPTQYWWWHYYVPGFPLSAGDDYWMSPCAGWRRGNHAYTDLDHTIDGLGWENHEYYNWENPNWEKIHQEEFVVQSEVWLKQVQWFNDSAWNKYRGAMQYHYPPDLHGRYSTLWEVADTTDHELYSEMESMDPYLGMYARDLQFIEAEIYTCTDSIIWEAFWESTPHDDTITWRTPRVELRLWDADGELVWEYTHHEDYDFIGGEHCDPCFLEYEATRDCCKDGGIMRIGPMEMIHHWLEVVRQDSVPESQLHPDNEAYVIVDGEGAPVTDEFGEILYTVYGYQHGDELEVTFGFSTRTPNMFTDPSDIHNYHEYHWYYDIDMQAPQAIFRRLEGTRGYAEVDCGMMHVDNNDVRIRLEDIDDTDPVTDHNVGLHQGGTDAEWTGTYPIPILKEGTDLVKYLWGTSADESAGLEYATATHYIYQNESHEVANCAEEINVARTMDFVTPITMYSGLDDGDIPIETTLNQDTLWIADSLYVEAVIQDRLGNEQYLRSNNLGLDNGLPEVKGFAFSSYDPETDEFNNWDEDFALLPWEVPDQDSLVGVYNFGEACTVYVRIWFSDNMDMRLADAHTGHIVRFQPDGWTHWFPVIPIETEIHPSLGMYPLAQRYVDYNYTDAGGLLRAVESEEADEILEAGDAVSLDDGWNSDREWIGYFVIAGDDLMDGIGKIRVQGFDDNAGNTMLARDFNFRIESQFIDPCMIWPAIEIHDTEPYDPWTMEPDDQMVVTGYDISDYFCSFEPHDDCFPIVSGCFDRTITDSVSFEFWWTDSAMDPADMIERIDTIEIDSVTFVYDTVWLAPDFYHSDDDMHSMDIWTEGEDSSYAQTTCDVLDILHEWYEDGVRHDGRFDKYVTIRFRAYSRFYDALYVEDYTYNLRVDNEKTYPNLTLIGGGELPPGDALHIIPAVTEETKICITSDEISEIDYINFTWTDMISDVTYGITDTIGDPEDEYLTVGDGTYEAIYDPVEDVICYTWETPSGMMPGLYRFCAYGYNEINIVTDYDFVMGEITGYNTYMHTFCFCRDSILIPNESFLARGDDYYDAIATICENYPAEDDCGEIYPWDLESIYPDWPGWTHVDSAIVTGYDHVNRFQITTFNNPDWTESDPLMRDYVETGGYPGDSLFILFRVGDVDSALIHIEDEYGGNVSGSNLEIIHMLYSSDIRMYMGAEYFVYTWVVDDQDNRYDGPVRVTHTAYRENFAGATIATDHVSFYLLDTHDPEYNVAMTRVATGEPLHTCISEDYPDEEALWVTNEAIVDIDVDWLQTVYDQDETGAEAYVTYDPMVEGRVWEHLRLTIDGEPHIGFDVADPNDLLQARFWQRNIVGPIDGYVPFWISPVALGDWTDFGDDRYVYRWTVANDLRGQGVADILVKGRDIAGNILTYEEARLSDSYGKKVLIDIEDPTVDAEIIYLTAEEMEADAGAIDDNYLGEGFEDPITGGYVFIEIWDLDETVMLGEDIWVNDDGSIDPSMVDLISGDTVLVCAIDLAGNRTCEEVVVQPHVESCVYHLYPGFNMVGISVHPEDSTDLLVENVFPGLDVYTLDGGVYNEVTDGTMLNHAEGYLVMAEVEMDIVLSGDPIEEFAATGLLPGWNLIGGPWTTVRTVDAGVYPADAIDLEAVHVYDGETGSYVPTTEFTHCTGHLVMVTTTDTAVVMVPDSADHAKYVYTGKVADELWNGMIKVDYDGTKKHLTFGVGNGATDGIDNNDVALFPTLPGQKDAYLDNHLAKSIVANDYQIEWDLVLHQDAVISPSIDGIPAKWAVSINGIDLRTVENLRLEAGTYKVTAEVTELPTSFELAQNSPNPFNPITSINYSVPSESHVTIEIFNVLGESVTTLVDEVQDAGSRTVRWMGTDEEGNKVTSGVYFYKMTAGGYSQTRKMSLVK